MIHWSLKGYLKKEKELQKLLEESIVYSEKINRCKKRTKKRIFFFWTKRQFSFSDKNTFKMYIKNHYLI